MSRGPGTKRLVPANTCETHDTTGTGGLGHLVGTILIGRDRAPHESDDPTRLIRHSS